MYNHLLWCSKMGETREFKCSNCNFKYVRHNDIFWINNNKLAVSPFMFSTSNKLSTMPVYGQYGEYYCYNCKKLIKHFKITEFSKNFPISKIKDIIENSDDSLKIIEFDDKFSETIECDKSYCVILNECGELETLNDVIADDYKFLVRIYTYGAEFSKAVLIDNPMNLDAAKYFSDVDMFLDKSRFECPSCNGEVLFLEESSKCPACEVGKLKLENVVLFD